MIFIHFTEFRWSQIIESNEEILKKTQTILNEQIFTSFLRQRWISRSYPPLGNDKEHQRKYHVSDVVKRWFDLSDEIWTRVKKQYNEYIIRFYDHHCICVLDCIVSVYSYQNGSVVTQYRNAILEVPESSIHTYKHLTN